MATSVAVCQAALADGSVSANLGEIARRLEALGSEVTLAVFPECTLTGTVDAADRLEAVALARDSDPITDVQTLAERHDVALVVGFLEAGDDGYYNATAYVGPDGTLTVSRKRHLWDRERALLTAGEELVTVETPIGTAGLLTCYDLNFVAESAALTRPAVDALLVVGAWPAAYSENWRLLVRARALDGVRWVLGANRTGSRETADGEQVNYAGRSLVARPDGGVHAALDGSERTLVTDLDPAVLERQRELVGIFDT